ncbi:DUF6904 family protein [Litchfieldia alkalitelluris]|uniref:DUF6904 family protein n=1 Tax=Litchfieldia alkalitelluris TaxID=304268 RepID=UPI000998E78A|nr:hypothetical protein [Litchfieldia alkalitelluris]
MIYINNTPNYAGVTVYGDFFDFEELYLSLHTIVGEEDEWSAHESSRIRVLGICYDIRHALMGHREIEMVDNGFDREKMKYLSIIANDKNVYMGFNVLWPELLFVTIVLNEFVTLYAKKQVKNSYKPILDYRNVWDSSIAHVRVFQAAILKCLKDSISESSYSRTLKLMNSEYQSFTYYATQYIDELNVKYLSMDKEKRQKNITIMAKRIAEQSGEYHKVREAVLAFAREHNCSINEVRTGNDYPEEIDW